tara:strand:+ start:874 stop:2115 length:1242 start_codon:yes stop_codon:yes gene_type:complete
MARNRVIYQSEALFVTHQYTGNQTIDLVTNGCGGVGGAAPDFAGTHAHIPAEAMHQIHRVQSANYNFAINRTDINQFGQLARIDTAVIDAPTVGLDFTYLVTNGVNEDALGISVDSNNDITPTSSAISGILSNISGRNYHILTVKEGSDANNSSLQASSDSTVISIGNGFITNYSVNASVGAVPTASVSVEGLNINAQSGAALMTTPAIDPDAGTQGTATFGLPAPVTGSVGEVIRPGDIQVLFAGASDEGLQGTGLLTQLVDDGGRTAAHINSFSIDLPLGRSVLQRLGNSFGFAREIDFPVQVSVSVSATVADLKAGNLFEELYENTKHDIVLKMHKNIVGGSAAGVNDAAQLAYVIKNATLDSESFSSSIGDNKSVDLSFTATIGGPQDTTNGLFISGTQCGINAIRGSE